MNGDANHSICDGKVIEKISDLGLSRRDGIEMKLREEQFVGNDELWSNNRNMVLSMSLKDVAK